MVNRMIEQGAGCSSNAEDYWEALCGGGMGEILQEMSSPPFTSHGSVIDSVFSSMEWGQSSPIFRVVTRIDCDHISKTPTTDCGTQWPLMITEANQ